MKRSPVFDPCPRCGAPRAVPVGCKMPGQWRCWRCLQVPVKPDATTCNVVQQVATLAMLAVLLCVGARAQTAPTIAEAQLKAVQSIPQTLPAFFGAAVSFNQLGSPRLTPSFFSAYPILASAGLFASTEIDVVPVKQFDAATGRQFIAFSTSAREGVHRLLGRWGKLSLLVGGDAGAGFSQDGASGTSINFAGSFSLSGVYQIAPHLSVVAHPRMLWLAESRTWNMIPSIGIVFHPN